MMRQPALLRPISSVALERESSYALAARWLKLARETRRWTARERVLGAWASRKATNLMLQQRDVLVQLVERFGRMFLDALTASGCPQSHLRKQLMFCLVRVQDLLARNRENLHLPEVMWRACEMDRRVPDDCSARLRARFHLRALLDELPESDARGALRYFVFPTSGESLSRLSGGPTFDDVYDLGRGKAVLAGLEQFATCLYGNRDQLELLTSGAIRAIDCHSVLAAHQFLRDTLLHA